jgi:AraC-like DNA-binding protein
VVGTRAVLQRRSEGTPMDVLSEVFRAVHVSGAVFLAADFSAPWALDSPNSELLASEVVPNADCVVLFHLVIEGTCAVQCPGHAVVGIEAGDVIVFPHGDSHTMRSDDATALTPLTAVLSSGPQDELLRVSLGGGGQKTRFLCGYLNCDKRSVPLMRTLPTMLVLRGRNDYAAIEAIDRGGVHPVVVPLGSDTWLSTTLKFTVNEARSGRPGNAIMLGRLTELMLVDIIREYVEELPAKHSSWLTGVKDAHVDKALRLLHAHPTRNWTVDELAHAVAISRSGFAQRFTKFVGQSPMRYLANWRIQLAKQMLREGGHSIQEIASRVGYESDAAFNRAFKREAGAPPATWRKAALHASAIVSPLGSVY